MRLPSTPAEDRLPVREIALLWLATASIFAIGYWTRLDESLGFTDNVMKSSLFTDGRTTRVLPNFLS